MRERESKLDLNDGDDGDDDDDGDGDGGDGDDHDDADDADDVMWCDVRWWDGMWCDDGSSNLIWQGKLSHPEVKNHRIGYENPGQRQPLLERNLTVPSLKHWKTRTREPRA